MRALLLGALLAGALVLGDLVLYRQLLVPRLPEWQSVPWYWWLLVLTPELAALVIVGLLVRNVRELLSCSAVAAILTAVYSAWAASSGEPGHLKGLEAPIQLVLTSVAAMCICIVAIGSIRWIAGRAVWGQRRRAV